jgi:hypothetical protein
MFKFQYKMTTCGGGSATAGVTYNGGTFRSAWNSSDFALMELNTSPIGDIQFSWLGWDRSGNSPTTGTAIHHPSGDVMKISFDNDAIPETSQGSTNTGTSHWYVDIDNGTLEGGSSGSPLFNQNRRVVGQLHSGYPGCSSSKQFWYGCFHRSWTGNGTNTTRLSNWLDPCGSGVVTTSTARTPYISGPSLVCTSGAIYTIILPAGLTATWTCTSTNNNLAINPTTGYAYATNTVAGTGSVSAIVHTGCGDITLPAKNIYVGSLPAPVLSGNTTIKCGYQLTYRVDNVNQENGNSFYWDSNILSISNRTSPTCTVWGGFDGTGYISCTVTACGISKTTTRNNVEVIMCSNLLLTPNPSTDQTTVSIESSSEKGFDPSVQWDLEVYEGDQLKTKTSGVKGKSATLNTSNWKDGVYIVRAKLDDQILTGKLVIKH